jgi:glycerophosphoryl diester phosphodiesterase
MSYEGQSRGEAADLGPSAYKHLQRVVAAHRGACRYAPENTVRAFEEAISRGARAIELDVHLTGDGELVVIHDALVDRTTDGRGAVASLTTGEVGGLDAGSWYSPDFAGERVPTLDQVLRLTAGRARLNIELKSVPPGPVAAKVVDAVTEHGAADRAVLMSFDLDSVLAAKRHSVSHGLEPGVSGLVVLPIVTERLPDPFGFVESTGLDGLNYPPQFWDAPTIRRFRDAGLVVHGGLINDRAVLDGFFEAGGQMADSDEPACFAA